MNNSWKREGLSYIARMEIRNGTLRGTCTRRLDFLSYHLIKRIHGLEKLEEMAKALPRDITYAKFED